MKLIFKTILLIFLFSGCEKSDFSGQIRDNWPEAVPLEGISILDQEIGLLYVEVVDTLLVAVTNRDTLIHVYDKELNHISSFGNKGRGPGEFAFPPVIQDVQTEREITKVLIHHQMGAELLSVDIYASAEQNELIVRERSGIPGNFAALANIFYMPSGGWVGIYDDRGNQALGINKRVGFYADDNDEITIFPLYNLEIDPYDRSVEMNLNARFPAIAPDRSKMAVAMNSVPKLEIFEIGSSTPERFILGASPGHRFSLEDYQTGNHVFYYRYISATNNYIYLLYSGYKANETMTEQKIQVIDWQGNPIAQYLISGKYNLSTFDVDEENRKIYGSSFNNDAVYLFDMNH